MPLADIESATHVCVCVFLCVCVYVCVCERGGLRVCCAAADDARDVASFKHRERTQFR